VLTDSVSGSLGLKAYYFDSLSNKGLLNLSDGKTWTMAITNINSSQILGDKRFYFLVQDYSTSSGYEITIEVDVNYYGPGAPLLISYDNNWVEKSSQYFSVGQVLGNFDVRMLIKDLGSNYQVTPQYRLPGADWQTFSGGSWYSANCRLRQTRLAVQLSSGSAGTLKFDPPTAHSNDTWYVDPSGRIQNAINGASPGNTVIVFNGTYYESLYVNKTLTMEAGNGKVTIEGGLSYTTQYEGGNWTREAAIFVVNSTNVILKNLVIEGQQLGPGSNDGLVYINSTGAVENCTVSPNTAGQMNSGGIEARESQLNIVNTTILDFGNTGVYFGNCTGGVFNSTIVGQVYNEVDEFCYGIEIDVYRQGPSTIEVFGNNIYDCDNTYTPQPSLMPSAIVMDTWRRYDNLEPSAVTMKDNEIHNNYLGLQLVSSLLSNASYNDIYSNRYGVIVYPDYLGLNVTFDACYNWWGNISGPSYQTNPSGTGETISDQVDYNPWLGEPFKLVPRCYCVNPTGTIQEAIDEASPGDTVLIKNGTYDEQLVINKSLSVEGFGGAVTIKPSSSSRLSTLRDAPWSTVTKRIAAIISVSAPNGGAVFLKNLMVDGSSVTAVPSGADFVVGILYLESSGVIDSVTVANIKPAGTDRGSGIYVGAENQSVSVEIRNVSVLNFRRNGIEASAGMIANKLTVSVHNCTIIGRGPLGLGEPAQVGILIANASAGQVYNNIVENLQYTGQGSVAAGILYLGSGGTASKNTLTNTQMGIAASGQNPGAWTVTVQGNTIVGSTLYGVHVEVLNPHASIALILEDNNLNGSGDGVSVGLSPPYSPAGNIVITAINNTISGWQNGIHLMSSVGNGSVIGGNTITQSLGSGILIEPGVNATNIMVSYNSIAQNVKYGVRNNSTIVLDASPNWWGSSTGPYHPTLNPSGKGDTVSNFVTFAPWLTKQPGLAVMQVNPSYSLIAYGQTFNLSVTLTGVMNTTGWQLTLYYSSAILNCTKAVEGPFLKSGGATFFYEQINNAYNATYGRVLLACTLLGSTWASGSGVLTTITFKAVSKGNTSLILADTLLADQRLPPQPIVHEVSNGAVQVNVIVHVNPSLSLAAVGDVLNTNVSVSGVTYLTGWQFMLYYKSSQLNCTSVSEGPFLKSGGATFFYKQINNAYNSTYGRLFLACSLLGSTWVNGSGVLTTITFKAVSRGNTTLHLDDVILTDQEMPPQPIPNISVDGIAEVGGIHDVAVTDLTSYHSIQGQGYIDNLTVTVGNYGIYNETFKVTVYANTTMIASQNVTLSPMYGARNSETITVAWNTKGFAYGNYTISANVTLTSGETNGWVGPFTYGKVEVTIPGDVDGNRWVNILDVVKITSIYGSKLGNPLFNPNCDINSDGKITILDVVACTSHYGHKWS
jgi:hypothetical protein